MAGFSPSGEVVKMDQQMGLLDRLAQMSGCVCLSGPVQMPDGTFFIFPGSRLYVSSIEIVRFIYIA